MGRHSSIIPPLTPAGSALVSAHAWAAHYAARPYLDRARDAEERAEILFRAKLATIAAAGRYDPAAGVSFGTFAVALARWHVSRSLRRPRGHADRPRSYPVAGWPLDALADPADPPDVALARRELPSGVAWALASLRPRQREVIDRRFGLGGRPPESLIEIGRSLCLTRERVRQIEAGAIEAIRDWLRLAS